MKTRYQRNPPMSYREDSPDIFPRQGRSIRSCRSEKTNASTIRKSRRLRDPEFTAVASEQLESELIDEIEPPVKSRKVVNNKSKPKVNQPSGLFYLAGFTLSRLTLVFFVDKCNFCNTDSNDVYTLGELKKCENITAHMYCLYFAPGLIQNGTKDEGIEGFLLSDIRKELKRGSILKCSYCATRGAVVGCKVSTCKMNYHLNCGIKVNI